MFEKIKVAIIQASPVFMNLEASLAKAVGLIGQPARVGASLVALGETWLPGYPAWLDHRPGAALWNHEPTKRVFARLGQNSVVVLGKETVRLGEAAREHNLIVVTGVNERVAQGPGNGTLYNSLLTFGPDGKLLNHHRAPGAPSLAGCPESECGESRCAPSSTPTAWRSTSSPPSQPVSPASAKPANERTSASVPGA